MAAPAPHAADRAAALSPDVRSPFLANAAVVVGFALIFTTFMTGSPWSWILGGLLVLAGGLWAGFSGRGTGGTAAGAVADAPEHGHGRTG